MRWLQAGVAPCVEHFAPVLVDQAHGPGVVGILVNINTATVEQLCTLNGIGESRAKTIIAYREAHGNFTKKEDIMKVTGIKESSYAKIKDQITVGKE